MSEGYRKLEEALNLIAEESGQSGVLTEYVVLASSQFYDEDGDHCTSVGIYVPPANNTPYHRLVGLMEYALIRYRKAIAEEE